MGSGITKTKRPSTTEPSSKTGKVKKVKRPSTSNETLKKYPEIDQELQNLLSNSLFSIGTLYGRVTGYFLQFTALEMGKISRIQVSDLNNSHYESIRSCSQIYGDVTFFISKCDKSQRTKDEEIDMYVSVLKLLFYYNHFRLEIEDDERIVFMFHKEKIPYLNQSFEITIPLEKTTGSSINIHSFCDGLYKKYDGERHERVSLRLLYKQQKKQLEKTQITNRQLKEDIQKSKYRKVLDEIVSRKGSVLNLKKGKIGAISNFDVPMQKVIRILHDLRTKGIDDEEEWKKQIDYILQIILNGTLYEIDLDDMIQRESDSETRKWISYEFVNRNTSVKNFNAMLRAYAKAIVFANKLRLGSSFRRKKKLSYSPSFRNQVSKSLCDGLPNEVLDIFEKINSMDYNVFQFSKFKKYEFPKNKNMEFHELNEELLKIQKQPYQLPLFYTALRIFEEYKFIENFPIPIHTLKRFLLKMQLEYRDENFYHNSYHAADVVQTVHFFLRQSKKVRSSLSDLDVLGIFLSAICHDLSHPGTNNSFEINKKSELALLYNDQSVLENYHCSHLFTIMEKNEANPCTKTNTNNNNNNNNNPKKTSKVVHDSLFNLLLYFPNLQQNYLRTQIVHMILATDSAKHFNIISQMKSTILKNFDSKQKEHVHILCNLLIKCGDVSNPLKKCEFYFRWVERVMEEFFIQGDLEKQLILEKKKEKKRRIRERGNVGITERIQKSFMNDEDNSFEVSPFMDRQITNIAKCQRGFVLYFCKPLFFVLKEFDFENFNQFYVELTNKYDFWNEYIQNKAKKTSMEEEEDRREDDEEKSSLQKVKSSVILEEGDKNIFLNDPKEVIKLLETEKELIEKYFGSGRKKEAEEEEEVEGESEEGGNCEGEEEGEEEEEEVKVVNNINEEL